jgi:hypothetical protein
MPLHAQNMLFGSGEGYILLDSYRRSSIREAIYCTTKLRVSQFPVYSGTFLEAVGEQVQALVLILTLVGAAEKYILLIFWSRVMVLYHKYCNRRSYKLLLSLISIFSR